MILGFAWALFVPGGQAPDEPSHTAYAQVLAERLGVPAPDEISGRERGYSTEQRLARDASHQQWQYAEPHVKTVWDPRVDRAWSARASRLTPHARSDGGGPNSAAGNPPLYYAYEALAYHAAGGKFFDRLFAMRMWSSLLLAVAVVATWLLVGELTGRDRLLQVVAGGVVGLQPMATFISGSINPDAGLIPLWALAFWLVARLLRRPATVRDVVALLVVTLAAVLTKASSFALLIGVAFALVVVGRRALRGRALAKGALVAGGAAVVALLAIAVAAASARVSQAFALHPGDIPGFASYLWQAYLPNLPFQNPIPNLAAFEGFDIWIRTGWAAFGWLEIQFPGIVYVVLAAVTVGLVVAGAVGIRRGRLTVDAPLIAFFAVTVLALVLSLHWAEFRQFLTQGQSFIQGRYMLPLLPIGSILTAAAVANLPRRRRGVAAALVLGGLFALQVFSLGLVAVRFYV